MDEIKEAINKHDKKLVSAVIDHLMEKLAETDISDRDYHFMEQVAAELKEQK